MSGWAGRHDRALKTAAIAALALSGLSALAVAPLAVISSLAPDAALLPQRLLVQPVPLRSAVAPQLRLLAAQELQLTRGAVVREGERIEALLARLGVTDREAAAFLQRNAAAARVLQGSAGSLVRVRTDAAGRLIELTARFPSESPAHRATQFARLVVNRATGGQWQSLVEEAAFGTQLRLAAGTIRSTLFAATEAADVPDAVAVQLAEIFAVDLDFHRQLKRGDRFVVVYEMLSADGEPVPWNDGAGRVLAAEFVNGARVHRALWFADPADATGTRGSYVGPDGTSRRRAFLASPLAFSRVSSGFAMRRDPINRLWRAHLGVDHVAPEGTPVRAVGDGVVETAGDSGGYGQTVTLAHGKDRVTLYAHLARIDVKPGERVAQGQTIGAVGATGWATGPHLHFEFRVHGSHQDPLAIAADARNAEVRPLSSPALARFAEQRRRALAQLALASSLAPDIAGSPATGATVARVDGGVPKRAAPAPAPAKVAEKPAGTMRWRSSPA
ncbi:MAG: M23 family metallopeptidase [Rubrivivax sp.]|nr:M23 family metallopeptidase [Rubrivivax sp.]